MALNVVFTQQGDDMHLTLSGVIDEVATLPSFDEVKGHLFIDLEKLTMINSIGCRNWIHWFRDVVRSKGGISLVKVSPAMVHQINILSGFLPAGAVVESFYVPYYCDDCGNEEQVLLKRGVDYDDVQVTNDVSERACGACGAISTPDIIKKRYFQFITKKAA